MRKSFAWKIAIFLILCTGLGIAYIKSRPAPDWHKGELYVALPPAGMDADAAFELELATLFAERLHLTVKPVTLDYEQITPALTAHKVHMAAAGMRGNSPSTLRFSSTYQTLDELVLCKDKPPRRLDDLPSRTIAVIAESAQENALRAVAERVPDLHWETRRNQTVSALLQEVAEGKLDCAVANEEQVALARNFYTQLGDEFDLNSPSYLAWAFPPDVDSALTDAAKDFFREIKKDRTLARLIDHHYGHNERLEPVDAVAFVGKTRTVLPHFKRWFEEASALTGIEWQLLAALAYQESHWDPHATSYTNVRGMMMLTEDTADRMNVDDRLDPHASIIAGAKYLQLLKDALPDRIDDKERTWLALAAYNQGMGHLEDARILAVKAGLNPDVWSDVRKVMPLLAKPEYFEQSKHGQARGGEAVILVETVRLYHDMLNRIAPEEMLRLPTAPYLGFLSGHPKLPNMR
jgi:membrane-bound lytic murein transglycosylase F